LLAYFNDMNFRDIHYKQKNIEKSTLDVVRQPIDNLYENITAIAAHNEFMNSEENQVDLYSIYITTLVEDIVQISLLYTLKV
jgi:hypothetical protein